MVKFTNDVYIAAMRAYDKIGFASNDPVMNQKVLQMASAVAQAAQKSLLSKAVSAAKATARRRRR